MKTVADDYEETTMNNKSHEIPLVDEYHPVVLEYIRQIPTLSAITALTMIVALVGNLFLAIIITTSSRRRLNPVQILIVHMCVADIMFALCTILPQLATFLTFPVFYGGDFLCRCVKYLQIVPMYASPYLLIAISIDRYMAICRPLVAYQFKYRMCQWLSFGAWALSFVLSAPQIFTFRYGTYTNSTILMCISTIEDSWVEQITITSFVALAWLLPSVLVCVLYTLVCRQVWISNRYCATPDSAASTSRGGATTFFPSSTVGVAAQQQKNGAQKTTERSSISLRKTNKTPLSFYKIKTVKLTITIVTCNFTLMAPFCMINFCSVFFPTVTENLSLMTITCIMLVGNLNSCVNPWIYLVYNYKQVWKSVCRDSQAESQSLLLTTAPSSFSPRPCTGSAAPSGKMARKHLQPVEEISTNDVSPPYYSSMALRQNAFRRWPKSGFRRRRKSSQTSLSETSMTFNA